MFFSFLLCQNLFSVRPHQRYLEEVEGEISTAARAQASNSQNVHTIDPILNREWDQFLQTAKTICNKQGENPRDLQKGYADFCILMQRLLSDDTPQENSRAQRESAEGLALLRYYIDSNMAELTKVLPNPISITRANRGRLQQMLFAANIIATALEKENYREHDKSGKLVFYQNGTAQAKDGLLGRFLNTYHPNGDNLANPFTNDATHCFAGLEGRFFYALIGMCDGLEHLQELAQNRRNPNPQTTPTPAPNPQPGPRPQPTYPLPPAPAPKPTPQPAPQPQPTPKPKPQPQKPPQPLQFDYTGLGFIKGTHNADGSPKL